jgi:hypothetical protein
VGFSGPSPSFDLDGLVPDVNLDSIESAIRHADDPNVNDPTNSRLKCVAHNVPGGYLNSSCNELALDVLRSNVSIDAQDPQPLLFVDPNAIRQRTPPTSAHLSHNYNHGFLSSPTGLRHNDVSPNNLETTVLQRTSDERFACYFCLNRKFIHKWELK